MNNMKKNCTCFAVAALFIFAGGFSLCGNDKGDERFIKEISEFSKMGLPSVSGYFEEISRKVIYARKGLISYMIKRSEYSGGAHGNYYSKCGSVFRKTGKKLTIRDIATPPQRLILIRLIAKEIMKSRNIKTMEEFKGKMIQPFLTEKFYYSEKGLHFRYDPNEIACFAEGEFEVCVKWPIPAFVLEYEKYGKEPWRE